MINIHEDDIIACICEGNSEKYLIQILLDREVLLFDKIQLLSDKVLSSSVDRDAQKFSKRYLTQDYGESRLIIIRILDKVTPFKIPAPYSEKVTKVINVVTAPEIEMLMVHGESLYSEFQKVKSKKKVSKFIAEHKSISEKKVKSKEYVENYFTKNDPVPIIKQHKSKAPRLVKESIYLADLLKDT